MSVEAGKAGTVLDVLDELSNSHNNLIDQTASLILQSKKLSTEKLINVPSSRAGVWALLVSIHYTISLIYFNGLSIADLMGYQKDFLTQSLTFPNVTVQVIPQSFCLKKTPAHVTLKSIYSNLFNK